MKHKKKVIFARVKGELASILQKKRPEQGLNPILESIIRERTMQQGSFVHKILQAPDPTDSTANRTMWQTCWSPSLPVPLSPGQTVRVPALLCNSRRSRQGCKGTSVSGALQYHGSFLKE